MKLLPIKTVALTMLLLVIQFNLMDSRLNGATVDKVQALKDLLNEMKSKSNNVLFINHCESFNYVISSTGNSNKVRLYAFGFNLRCICRSEH